MKIYQNNIQMIRGYKFQSVLDSPSDNCSLIKAVKDGKTYLLHEFEDINQSDEYSFKVRKKLLKCSHILLIIEDFQQNDKRYYVSEYLEVDLCKLALSRAGHVLQLQQALSFFAKIIDVLDELHTHKLVYRNLRPQTILIKQTQPYFHDFSLSQFLKRKQRLFQVVGCGRYLAPEYFSQDGYGQQVDIWAAGVMLFYLLVHQYPFNFKGDDENAFRQEFQTKCGDGFRFSKQIENTNFYAPPLKGNKHVEDFFKKIFHPNPNKRLTINEIRQHPLMEGHFPNHLDQQTLAIIQQGGREQSVFLSKMYKFPCSKILHKEQVILDFIQQTSQLFLLECPDIYEENLRYRAQFSVLKVGLLKCRDLLDICFGKKDPFFKIDPEQWKQVRGSTALNSVKDKLERKQKILHMIYKNAYLNLTEFKQKDSFFNEEIPETFDEIKISYRGNLSEMFEVGRKNLAKTKGNRKASRKLTESLVRVIILFLVNRLFETQQQLKIDFALYFQWSKRKDLQDLQEWIQTEQLANLKQFMKSVTSKYL